MSITLEKILNHSSALSITINEQEVSSVNIGDEVLIDATPLQNYTFTEIAFINKATNETLNMWTWPGNAVYAYISEEWADIDTILVVPFISSEAENVYTVKFNAYDNNDNPLQHELLEGTSPIYDSLAYEGHSLTGKVYNISDYTFKEYSWLSGISADDLTASTEDGTYNVNFTMPAQPIEISATFESTSPAIKHTVTFNVGLITVDTVEVEDGTAIPSADIPTVVPPTGMEFNYWADENNNEFNFNTLITEDITLYAKFKVSTHTVTFKEGEETIAEVEVAHNKTVKDRYPDHMTDANGKEFVYWLDENNEKFDFKTPITEDITLTAYYAQAGSPKWLMSLPNCYVGLKSDIDVLPIARVADGTKALALSATEGEETAYMFNKATLTWIELQHYSVRI